MFVTGQPFGAKYLDLALEYFAAQPDVWLGHEWRHR
jgi:hypothetical protein